MMNIEVFMAYQDAMVFLVYRKVNLMISDCPSIMFGIRKHDYIPCTTSIAPISTKVFEMYLISGGIVGLTSQFLSSRLHVLKIYHGRCQKLFIHQWNYTMG